MAATDRARIGESLRDAPYFVDTLRSRDNIFTIAREETGAFRFFYTRRVDSNGVLAGMIVVEVNLQKFESAWAGISDAVLVTNSEGQIILATDRPVSFQEAYNQTQMGDFDVSLIILNLDENNKGEGILSLGTELKWNEKEGKIEMTNVSSQPIKLGDVRPNQ